MKITIQNSLNICIVITFAVLAIIFKDDYFTPDSWTYYELSQTIFSDHFYEFSFQRSYGVDRYSTSFPLGYPTLIAILNLLVANTMYSMLIINLLSLAGILYLTSKIKQFYKVKNHYIIEAIIITSSCFYEFVGGRTIIPTIFVYLIFVNAFHNRKYLLAFIALGFTPLLRFDFLPVVVLTLLYINYYYRFTRTFNLLVLIGLSPWITYSYMYHGVFWATDNSWVPLSADPLSYVHDYYPSSETIFNAPVKWLHKVYNNSIAFFSYFLFQQVPKYLFPLLPIFVIYLTTLKTKKLRSNVIEIFILVSSCTPYIFTKYYAPRYFIIHCVILTLYLLRFDNKIVRTFNKISVLVLLVSIFATQRYTRLDWAKNTDTKVQELFDSKKDGVSYLFKNTVLGAKYGALTKDKCYILPHDYERMNEAQKSNFHQQIGPFELIE